MSGEARPGRSAAVPGGPQVLGGRYRPRTLLLGLGVGLSMLPGAVPVLLALSRPAEQMDGPDLCAMHRVTGLWCPLCGGTRATRELLCGDVAGALGYNPFALVTEALAIMVVVRWLVAWCTGRRRILASSREMVAYSVAAVAFAVVRNLPGMWVYLGASLGPGALG